jgi:hypothetical protein
VVSDNHFIFLDENNPFMKTLNLEKSEALESELNPGEMFVALNIMKMESLQGSTDLQPSSIN